MSTTAEIKEEKKLERLEKSLKEADEKIAKLEAKANYYFERYTESQNEITKLKSTNPVYADKEKLLTENLYYRSLLGSISNVTREFGR